MKNDNKTPLSQDLNGLTAVEISDSEKNGIRTIQSLKNSINVSFIAILICVTLIFSVVLYSAEKIDQFANKKAIEQIEHLIEMELEDIASVSLEYGWWNEAIEMVIYNRDMAWAESNAGGYLQKTYNMDWVLSLDSTGELVHGKRGEKTIETIPAGIMTSGLKRLVNKAVKTDTNAPKPVNGIININGVPGLVGVTSFTTYEPTEYDIDRSHGALILIKMLDEKLLSEWDFHYKTGKLIFSTTDMQHSDTSTHEYISTPIITAAGVDVGKLHWPSESPSKLFLKRLAPLSLLAGSFVILFSIFFLLKMKNYSKIATSNFVALTDNREKLLKLANYDFLTGLSNRSLFMEHITREIAHCIRHDRKSAVIYIDLDGFKSVNDTLGHSVGDELLVRTADTLRTSVRKEDVVARFGGDEFCILLTDISEIGDIYRIIDKIHQHFSIPVTISNMQLTIGASIGIVIIPDDTTDVSNVFRFSDIAMYKAKSTGANCHCFYTTEMEERYERQAKVKSLLMGAIEGQELYLNYQPIYALDDRKITGLEALARWQNEDLGQVSPAEFIPLAEESNTISCIGYWVFDQALKDLVKITQTTDIDLTMSINISVRQLMDRNFSSRIEKIRHNHGVDSSRIFLEITETLLITEQDHEHSVLRDLSNKGYQLVLDDFGTGYSALGYLQHFPLSVIKIDKSFVGECVSSKNFLLKTIVYMSDMAGMKTVAEGIETPEQEEFLQSLGCSYGQGFYFSRPAEIDDIISLVKTKQCHLPS